MRQGSRKKVREAAMDVGEAAMGVGEAAVGVGPALSANGVTYQCGE